MKKIWTLITVIAVAGCTKNIYQTKPQYKIILDKILLAEKEAKIHKIESFNPDLWEGISMLSQQTKTLCRMNDPRCFKLYQRLRNLIIEAINLKENLNWK